MNNPAKNPIEKLKENDSYLKKHRWTVLIAGIAMLIAGFAPSIYALCTGNDAMFSKTSNDIGNYITSILGAFIIGYSYRCFRGNPTTDAIIKLANDHKQDT